MKKDNKIILAVTMTVAVLAAIASVLFSYVLFKEDVPMEEQGAANAMWGISYWVAVIMTVISAVLGIVFLLKDAIAAKARFLIILGATIVVLIISYFCASGTDIPQQVFEKVGSDYGSSKIIGAGMYTAYVLFAGVILSILYAEISKRFK